jgi:hypothetical protein
MARNAQTIQANNLTDLATAINAFLAPLIGGSATKIIGFYIVQIDADRFLGQEYIAIITTDTTGAAALAAPYVWEGIQAGNATDLDVLQDAYLTTHNAHFVAGFRNISSYVNSRLKVLTSWNVSSTDAANAATNWAPR